MSAAALHTFDPVMSGATVVTPATRPSIEDVGGARFLDPKENAPPHDGVLYLYDAMLNQLQWQVAALSKMAPSARFTISFSGGTPSIAKLTTMSHTLVSGDFTITDGGLGITTIAWLAGKLPAVECDPMVSVDTSGLTGVLTAHVARPTATSVQVRTFDDGVAADIRFTIAIH